jgi:hypothetical protein
MRFFNTAGPVNCEKHYCLPPLTRLNLDEILRLIHQEKYFVLHAPRQTGKTSALLYLVQFLNQEGKFRALYINVESAQAARENVAEAMKSILDDLAFNALHHLNDPFIHQNRVKILEESGPFKALNTALTLWTRESPLPLVILIDEVDSLVGDTLISLLRQIRSGYTSRPLLFPQSIVLCGVRDVRDYRIHSSALKEIITGGSAFNIKAESLRLGDFTKQDIQTLYQCHTEETGQKFNAAAIDLVWELTEGQPWLVNALGYEVCFKMKQNLDRSKNVSDEDIAQAKENLILRRETHLDQLADKLREPRVRSVIEPLMTGTSEPAKMLEDDIQYAVDLGLIRRKPHLTVSNPIYREIIPRLMTESTQDVLTFQTQWFVLPDGSLDMNKLLKEFQNFFREHSEHWVERFDYKEAGPQLLMQAFLQRIVNSGGRVEREYGLGRKRVDLFVLWKYREKIQKIVIELKLLYSSLEKTMAEGLEQTNAYMDKCGTAEGHLVIFDRTPERTWEEKIFRREEAYQGKTIAVWGM